MFNTQVLILEVWSCFDVSVHLRPVFKYELRFVCKSVSEHKSVSEKL